MHVRSGVILAGGRSTRFGDTEKAVADLAGTPMIRRVADRIAPVVDELVVNCRDEQRPAIDSALDGWRPDDDAPEDSGPSTDGDLPTGSTVPDADPEDHVEEGSVSFAIDPEPDRGPMAGIRTGLERASGEYAFVVACDMPFVDPEVARYLFECAMDHDAAVARLDDQWFQTTQAVYRTGPMVEACEATLQSGARKILEPLFELDYVVVSEAEVESAGSLDTFDNVNTRSELEAAAERIQAE